eukprot:scaffold12808_cov76-Skeletonema_dohrnii-CCMP3373.AAC.6
MKCRDQRDSFALNNEVQRPERFFFSVGFSVGAVQEGVEGLKFRWQSYWRSGIHPPVNLTFHTPA